MIIMALLNPGHSMTIFFGRAVFYSYIPQLVQIVWAATTLVQDLPLGFVETQEVHLTCIFLSAHRSQFKNP